MPFETVLPPKKFRSGTGISCSLRAARSVSTVCIFINEAAQKDLFGGPVANRTCRVGYGTGPDAGLLQIIFDKDGDLQFTSGVRGTAVLKLRAWQGLPKDKRPSVSIAVKQNDERKLVLQMPFWATPEGRMAEIKKLQQGPTPGVSTAAEAGQRAARAAAMGRTGKA